MPRARTRRLRAGGVLPPCIQRARRKAQSRFSTPQLVGLRAIGELPRLARRILVYLGDRELRTAEGIEIWPFDRVTKAAATRSLWP